MNKEDREETPSPKKEKRGLLREIFVRHFPWFLGLVVLAVGIALFLPVFGKPLIELVRREDRASSELVLSEIKDVFRLSSVSYFYKVIFPYDFIPPDFSEGEFLRKKGPSVLSDAESFRETGMPSGLNTVERRYWKALELAQKYKLNLKAPDYHFIVATVNFEAGFDLGGLAEPVKPTEEKARVDSPAIPAPSVPEELANKKEEDRKEPFSLAEKTETRDGKTSRVALLRLPPVTITKKTVEDPDTESYPFPDLPLSPEGWKEISALMLEQAEELALRDGILEHAEKNARSFLEEVLLSAGFARVEFSNAGADGLSE